MGELLPVGLLGSGGRDSGAAAFVKKGSYRLRTHEFFQSFEVFPKNRLALHGILQALQIRNQGFWTIDWQRVEHPALVALAGYEIALPQISQMLGDDDLRFTQDRLDVADAQRRNGQKIENPKAGLVAEALVEREQFHAGRISAARYKSTGMSMAVYKRVHSAATGKSQTLSLPRWIAILKLRRFRWFP